MSKISPPLEGRARIADLTVHALGVPLGAIGAVALVVVTALYHTDDPLALVAIPLYAAALVAMFSFSAAYNLTRHPGRRSWLRRIDHATIYLMIAGTYTPFMLIEVGGTRGTAFAILVWLVALAGAALKLAYPHRLERLSIALYLLLGWSVLAVLDPLLSTVDTASLLLLLGGGLVYTAGVPIYLMNRFIYHRAVWHAFVLLAAVLHYAAIFHTVIGSSAGA